MIPSPVMTATQRAILYQLFIKSSGIEKKTTRKGNNNNNNNDDNNDDMSSEVSVQLSNDVCVWCE